MQIGIIGGGEEKLLSNRAKKIAFDIGYGLAKKGAIVITGGLGGVMEYASKGAKKADGVTVGVLPFCDKSIANKFLDIEVATGMSYGIRNNIVIHSSDVLIAIAGGAGTLSEIALSDMYQKPIIIVKGTGGWSDKLKSYDYLDGKKKRKLIFVESAKEAITKVIELIKKSR